MARTGTKGQKPTEPSIFNPPNEQVGAFATLLRRWEEPLVELGPRLLRPLWGVRDWRTPRVDIRDAGEAYEVTVELPGVPKDNVQIGVLNDHLEVRGHTASRREEATTHFYYQETGRRAFYRSLPLPTDADPGQVGARMEDGCAIVSIQKRPPATSNLRPVEIA